MTRRRTADTATEPAEETLEVRFSHHHRDRATGTDYLPEATESFPVDVARALVAGRVAVLVETPAVDDASETVEVPAP